ncbi:MAG TPA: glycosyltransferase family 1 protein, partial [Candidatus Saccharimonadales bacterium]|nr:glycosyltransferase family 1 protein [Candidatus Saccharimonadales bacterium]
KNKNHKFIVFLKEKPQLNLPKETTNFKYYVFGPKKLWTQFALPVKLTIGPKIDVFFSTAHYGPRFSKVPYVVTIHDLSYLHFPELFKKNDLMQLTNWSKYSIEKSTHIIAPSQSTKEDIIKNYNVPASKISVTYEGYDQARFKPQSKSKVESVKSKYKIGGDYILFVGTLQPRKNIERLIEAYANLSKGRTSSFGRGTTLSGVGLVIAGKKGWLYDSIFEKVKELKLQDKVIFTDFVRDDDLPALISGAKVYVNPSLWEGFGIPVIEAQACGVPVVVSNTSSLPEIVGNSALTFDPTNVKDIESAIIVMLTDEKLRSVFTKKGQENIKRFSWEKCAQETIKVLEKAKN